MAWWCIVRLFPRNTKNRGLLSAYLENPHWMLCRPFPDSSIDFSLVFASFALARLSNQSYFSLSYFSPILSFCPNFGTYTEQLGNSSKEKAESSQHHIFTQMKSSQNEIFTQMKSSQHLLRWNMFLMQPEIAYLASLRWWDKALDDDEVELWRIYWCWCIDLLTAVRANIFKFIY